LRAAGSVFAAEEAALLVGSGTRGAALEALVGRREAGEPLEVLLGWTEFAGRRLAVAAGVFVPRRRTELLARLAAASVPPGGVAVDLCCGVGAVAVVLAEVADVEVHAVDADPVAAECAQRNLAGRGEVHVGDLWGPLPDRLRGRVDVIAANAPYVPSAQLDRLPREARDHEPRAALDGGGDGVDVHRRIAAGAGRWLAPGGVLLVETSTGQAGLTAAAMRDAGLVVEMSADVVVDEEVGGCVVRGVRQGRVRPGEPG
jgi:release factor glutamine methyltransferase